MSIIKKYILYLIKDNRTGNVFNQVVGKTRHNYKLNEFIDIKLELPDNDKEWVLCRVCNKTANVICLVIEKDVKQC